MDGLRMLHALPDTVKQQITAAYGGVDRLYMDIFALSHKRYSLYIQDKVGNGNAIKQVDKELFDIETLLESFDADLDGRDIITEISSDQGEIIVAKKISQLDAYLSQYGTDFITMRKWMKDTYGI